MRCGPDAGNESLVNMWHFILAPTHAISGLLTHEAVLTTGERNLITAPAQDTTRILFGTLPDAPSRRPHTTKTPCSISPRLTAYRHTPNT